MYQAAHAALIRAASYPRDLTLPAWPDLTANQPDEWLEWLREVWALPEFAAAVEQAAPDLATQITHVLAQEPMPARRARRLVETTVRYLLRWTTRPTPFGRFAGVAPLTFGPRAALWWGDQHHEVVRLDDRSVAAYTAVTERDLVVLRGVTVMTNTLGYRRGGVWVLPCARVEGDRVWDVEITLTAPVRVAVEKARAPIPFQELAATVAENQAAATAKAERLLGALVGAGVLLSVVRPPMTVTDPALPAKLVRGRGCLLTSDEGGLGA